MVSTRTGHFVQIHRDVIPHGRKQEYIEVEGRKHARWADSPVERWRTPSNGWRNVSRELDFRRARFYAKAYKRAGFTTRIILRDARGTTVVKTYEKGKTK